jgi:hypothetical protein
LGGPEGLSYGAVFLVEAVGTVVAIILLLQLDLVEFRAQSVEGPELLTEIGA